MKRLLVALIFLAGSAHAQNWVEPQRGTALRKDLMDAIRPHMEWIVGSEVQFVVYDLRVAGNVAFASLNAQHLGGGEINMALTPGAARGEYDPEFGDGATIQALLQKSGNTWVAVHHEIGATDAWWFYDAFCPIWSNVIPEACKLR